MNYQSKIAWSIFSLATVILLLMTVLVKVGG